MTPDHSRPPPRSPEEARRALHQRLAEQSALHRRRLVLTGTAVGLLVCAAFRLGVSLGAHVVIRPLARLDLLIAGFAVLVAVWALRAARRADMRLARIQQEISALRLLREALDHRLGQGLAIADEEPLGAAPPADAAAQPRPARMGVMSMGMAIAAGGIVIAAAVSAAMTGASGGHEAPERRWTFLEQVSDPTALGFRVVVERAGEWKLADHAEATGARALLNFAGAPGERPAIAVVERLSQRDLSVKTRCKFAPDHPAQACGIVFRYRHDRAYYVARADAASAAVTLVAVEDGVERELHRAAARARPSVWQELSVHARGDRILVEWNGQQMIDLRDQALPGAGSVGLWAPAEGMAYFDELAVQPVAAALGVNDVLPRLLR